MKTLLVNKSTDDTADNNLSSVIIIFFTGNNIHYLLGTPCGDRTHTP